MMLTGNRRRLVPLLVIAGTVAIALAVLLWQRLDGGDPCESLSHAELAARYPELARLRVEQQLETEQLLARQRAEDFQVNLMMSSEQVNMEQALRMSQRQGEQIARLRERQGRQFMTRCKALVAQR